MSCGFGAVVLVFLIIDHSMEVETKTLNAEVFSEIDLLEEDIEEGQLGLVALRNALASVDVDIVEAQGLATRVTEDLDRYEALIASLEEEGFTDTTDVEALKAEINRLEDRVSKLREAAKEEAGKSARDYTGDGNRQYLTGLNLGGNRIAILIDTSASMLAPSLAEVIRLRGITPEIRRTAPKWQRAIKTVEWLTSQLPINAQYQIITFNTEAHPILQGTAGKWLEVADTFKLKAATEALREQTPSGGTNLHGAFAALTALPSEPDNIFLITDGLPTQNNDSPTGKRISSKNRQALFDEAIKYLPNFVPVNIILAPMEGDPKAASKFWELAQISGGSFMSPSRDWP